MATQRGYTICDYYAERELNNDLLNLEIKLKDHIEIFKTELDFQQKEIEILWELASKRAALFNFGIPGFNIYPDDIADGLKSELIAESYERSNLIFKSNKTIRKSFSGTVKYCKEFEDKFKKFTFMPESLYQRSLYRIVELIRDYCLYFKNLQSKLHFLEVDIKPEEIATIEKYILVVAEMNKCQFRQFFLVEWKKIAASCANKCIEEMK